MSLWKKLTLVILTGAVIFVWYDILSASQGDGTLSVYVFDVGQGDSIFIETKSGNQILIDGGPTDEILGHLGRVMPFNDRTIDMIILTHPDADHVNGLVDVLERYSIGAVLETGVVHETSAYVAWHTLIASKNIPIIYARAGQDFLLDEDVILSILAPFEYKNNARSKKINNTSIVARLDYGESSLLLTGDIEASEEQKLVIVSDDLDVDILKVGHHGSKTSSSGVFLQAVTPSTALISVGRNSRYGHPHKETLDNLTAEQVDIYRTDVEGTLLVRIQKDGTYTVESENYGKLK